jgi:hypothetical protein
LPAAAGGGQENPSVRGQKLFFPRPLLNFCPLAGEKVQLSTDKGIDNKIRICYPYNINGKLNNSKKYGISN